MSKTLNIVLSKAELELLFKPAILGYTKRYEAEYYEVRVRIPGQSRTQKQLNFYWFLINGMCEYSGYTKMECHRHIKYNFLDLDISVSELDCSEFSSFLEKLIPYALNNGYFEEDVYQAYERTKL